MTLLLKLPNLPASSMLHRSELHASALVETGPRRVAAAAISTTADGSAEYTELYTRKPASSVQGDTRATMVVK